MAVFSERPLFPYQVETYDPAVVAEFAGSGLTQRASTLSRARRRWNLRYRGADSMRATVQAFFVARRGAVEAFYWKDLVEYQRTGIVPTPSTGDGVNSVFTIPTTGEYGGDYPVDDVNAVLKVNGSPVTKTVNTDNRSMTASSPPAGGAAITMDYHYYRKVRFENMRIIWRYTMVNVYECDVVLVEEAP